MTVASAPVQGFRLSPQQGRLFAWQGEAPGLRVVLWARLPGTGLPPSVSAARLAAALDRQVADHEILRTRFPAASTLRRPVQVIDDAAAVPLTRLDLSALAEERRDDALALAAADLGRPFDLASGPVVRCLLALRRSDGAGRLGLSLPAACGDGASVLQLAGVLAAAATAADPAAEGEEPLQYADLAEWQHQLLEEEAGAGTPGTGTAAERTVPPLPFPPPGQGSGDGATDVPAVPATAEARLCRDEDAAAATLERLAAACRVRPPAVLLAAWAALLGRLTETGRLAFGVADDGRRMAELAATPGLLCRHLPVVLEVAPATPFAELATRAESLLEEGRATAELYDPVPPAGRPAPDHFPWTFAAHALPEAGAALRVEDLDVRLEPAAVALDCLYGADRLRLSLRFDRERLAAAHAGRLLTSLTALLADAAAGPGRPVGRLALVGAEEVRRLAAPPDAGNAPAVTQRVAAAVANAPDRVAVVAGGLHLTYGELDRRACRLAAVLRRRWAGSAGGDAGTCADRPVAVCLRRGADLPVAALAVLRTGAPLLLLDPELPQRRLRLLATDAGVRVAVAPAERSAALGDVTVVPPGEVAADSATADVGVATPEPHPESAAYLIFTSGSTGEPKAVVVPHRALANHLAWLDGQHPLETRDRVLHKTPVGFDVAVRELLWPLATGATLVVARPGAQRDADHLATLVARGDVTILNLVPAQLSALLDAWPGDGALRRLISGGEALTPDLVGRWRRRRQAGGARLFNHYGPTETTITATAWDCESAAAEVPARVPIGSPVRGLAVRILDRCGAPVPVGVPGELVLAGAGLARGYRGRPGLTAGAFRPDPFGAGGARAYHTGDRCRWRRDGTLDYLGRLDDQVKVRGVRIELGEVEAVLRRHPGVAEVAVTRIGDGDAVQLVALATGADGPCPADALRAWAAERLPDPMVPARIVAVDALPRLRSGKLDRRGLPELAAAADAGASTAPRTAGERAVAAVWCELLERDRVGVEEDFFALGGHSILATRMVGRLRRELGAELTLRDFFATPTVAGLAARLEPGEGPGAGSLPPLEPAPEDGEIPLSFPQERVWFAEHLHPGDGGHNVPAAVRLVGDLSVAAVEQALAEVARRHEPLRSRYPTHRGRPRVMMDPPAVRPVPVVDLGCLAPEDREPETDRLSAAAAGRPFDLGGEALLRVRLLRSPSAAGTGAAEHRALFTLHHIVTDGWSTDVLVRELGALYGAWRRGEPSPLPEPSARYRDFALWQRRAVESGAFDDQLAWWQKRLADLPSEPLLPPERRHDEAGSRAGRRLQRIPDALATRLEALAAEEGTTPFAVLLAALDAVLARWSGRRDLAVGTDVANRPFPETEELVGFFVNHVVLRVDAGGNPTFRELLGRAREAVVSGQAHQDLPFDRLVEHLRPERRSGRTPLFQVLLVLHNQPRSRLKLPGVELELVPVANPASKFDLSLFVFRTAEGLLVHWVYRRDLLRRETVERLSDRFAVLLADALARPDTRLEQLELTSQEEKEDDMKDRTRSRKGFSRFAAVEPQAVNLDDGELVTTGHLQGEEPPLVLRPAIDDLDLVDWVRSERARLEEWQERHGALLFRGFPLQTAEDFEAVAAAFCPDLYGDYGDLPQNDEGERIYHSTPYPPDKTILFHNESSHLPTWPQKQFFFCVQPARARGETPFVDCRRVWNELDPELADEFRRRKLRYVRNFTEGLDVSWSEFFRTEDRAEVERRCREAGMGLEWRGDDLRVWQVSPAVVRHPSTGELCFFNQIQLHHPACLDPEVRESLLSVFGEDGLPRNVRFGDGGAIQDDVVRDLLDLYWRLSASYRWETGDLLMVDNLLVAHARNPYEGPRKIAVALGRMVGVEAVDASLSETGADAAH